MSLSIRGDIITRRTYSRIKDDGTPETWANIVDRVIRHQLWLWERAGRPNRRELEELRALLISKRGTLAGRTLWMGGTPISQEREATNFNCSALRVETVHDMVDTIWLLLQGCGVGAMPVRGTLNGFLRPIEDIQVIRSTRTEKGGRETNKETWDPESGVWTLAIGDSGEAWAKAIGKLLAGKYPAKKLVFDLSAIRPGGGRLSGYGWISAGDAVIADALPAIARIMSRRAGSLLTRLDIMDVINWLGVIQTGRRGAEIILMPYGDNEWRDFALAKREYWVDNPQRAQSNNSLVFYNRPSKKELREIFDIIIEGGGSEPGFINGEAALRRADYFRLVNPCSEILLGSRSFCNLVDLNVGAFRNDPVAMQRAIYLLARANYRQTCVDLDDGVLQRAWHENNEYLRLCGTGLTGVVRRPDLTPHDYRQLRNMAVYGAYSMADELDLPRPKNVTTVKPSGTVSKIMDTTEGAHKPPGRYLFNNVNFSNHDPLIPLLRGAGYRVFPNPVDQSATIVSFPVSWEDVQFGKREGVWVNTESAITQLERYKMLMVNYVDHNCSLTVSYDKKEIPAMVDWLFNNWDDYVGVSFLLRQDPMASAESLGHPYLPQEVVDKGRFDAYMKDIKPVNLKDVNGNGDLEIDVEDCVGGTCPVR